MMANSSVAACLQPCSHDGDSLLSDIGYIEPTSIDAYIRGNKLSPVLDAGDSTQAPTAWIWGEVVLLAVTYHCIDLGFLYYHQLQITARTKHMLLGWRMPAISAGGCPGLW